MSKLLMSMVVASLACLNFLAVGLATGAIASEGTVETYQPTDYIYLAQLCKSPECDLALLEAIIWCESSWKMVKNPVSSAYGYFQIIDGTERTTPQFKEGKSKYNAFDNLEMGVFLYQRDQHYPWMESKVCWDWRYRSKAIQEIPTCLGPACQN